MQALRAMFPGGTITGCPQSAHDADYQRTGTASKRLHWQPPGYLNHDGSLTAIS